MIVIIISFIYIVKLFNRRSKNRILRRQQKSNSLLKDVKVGVLFLFLVADIMQLFLSLSKLILPKTTF